MKQDQGRFNYTRPILTPDPAVIPRGRTLYDIRGNTFTFGTLSAEGLKATGTVTSVPAETPTLGTTYNDGLGYAYDFDNSFQLVWVAYRADDGDGAVTGWPGAIGRLRYVWSDQSVKIPVSGGGGSTVAVHLVTAI